MAWEGFSKKPVTAPAPEAVGTSPAWHETYDPEPASRFEFTCSGCHLITHIRNGEAGICNDCD